MQFGVLSSVFGFADLVEELVQKGRQVDAVRLIQSFELTHRYPPVPLLKAYLAHSKDADKSYGETAAITQVIVFKFRCEIMKIVRLVLYSLITFFNRSKWYHFSFCLLKCNSFMQEVRWKGASRP